MLSTIDHILKLLMQVQFVANAGNNIGRGLIANETIEEGDLLFRIPLEFVMSSEALRHHPVLGPFANLVPGEVNPRSRASMLTLTDSQGQGMVRESIAVSLLLMYESCLGGAEHPAGAVHSAGAGAFPAPPPACRGRAAPSKWEPYIRILPANFTAPFFWSPAQLRELTGSQVGKPLALRCH